MNSNAILPEINDTHHILLMIMKVLKTNSSYYEQYKIFFNDLIKNVNIIPQLIASKKIYDNEFHFLFCDLWKKINIDQEKEILNNQLKMLEFFYKLREALYCGNRALAIVKLNSLCETSIILDDFFKERIHFFLEMPETKEAVKKCTYKRGIDESFSKVYNNLIKLIDNKPACSPSKESKQEKPVEENKPIQNTQSRKASQASKRKKRNRQKKKAEANNSKFIENYTKFVENHPFFAPKRKDTPRINNKEVEDKASENELLRGLKALDLAQVDRAKLRLRNK